MKKFNLFLSVSVFATAAAFVLLLAGPAATAAPAKSKKLNTQLYEQDAGASVSGKVKAVREIQEETEVFLDVKTGSGGPFVLPRSLKNRAAAMAILTRSQKPGGPGVILQIDDQQRIKSVEETAAPDDGNKSGEKWEL